MEMRADRDHRVVDDVGTYKVSQRQDVFGVVRWRYSIREVGIQRCPLTSIPPSRE